MAKRMLECMETVIMDDGETQAFTEGRLYRPYRYNQKDGWDTYPVLCVKNDQNERHTIKKLDGSDESFFIKHFKEVYV